MILGATTTNDDLLGGVNDFFDSGAWLVIRNLAIFFVVVFWLATAYWVYKDARRRIEESGIEVDCRVLNAEFDADTRDALRAGSRDIRSIDPAVIERTLTGRDKAIWREVTLGGTVDDGESGRPQGRSRLAETVFIPHSGTQRQHRLPRGIERERPGVAHPQRSAQPGRGGCETVLPVARASTTR